MSDDVGYGGPRWKPEGIDVERPSAARVYDYMLGGVHNFDVDRQVADEVLAADPGARQAIQANRAFLRRAVRFLIDVGVRQFLDVGSGIPIVGHVHDIAQMAAPDSRVVYVDIDPVAVAHSRDVVRRNERTAVVQEDVRRPEQILDAPEVRQLLDLEQPVAVLVMALFHYVSYEDDPVDIVSRLTAPLVSGSYLALSHMTDDGMPDMPKVRAIYRRSGIEMTSRTRQEVEALFGGFDLVDPGVVWAPQWHPDTPTDIYYDEPESSSMYVGVGRKN